MYLPDMHQLQAFIVLAQDLNFHRSARKLNFSQPALTRIIKSLEAQIGCVLFHRTTRKVELTPAGQAFLPEARRAVLHARQALIFAREASKGRLGHLSIGYTTFALGGNLPEIIAAFRKKFPNIQLTLHDLSTHQQSEALAENRIDIGFGMPSLARDEHMSLVTFREPINLYISEDHPLAAQPKVRVASLRDEVFVLGNWSLWQPYRNFVDELCMRHGRFMPRMVQEATEMHIILSLVAARLGITLFPGDHTLGIPGIVIRPLKDPNVTLETAAVWHRDNNAETLRSFTGILKRITRKSFGN
jgi:DNA-binding transcriptional LysR family regulator